VSASIPVFSQDRSNRGKEFWLGYGFNYGFFNDPPVNQQELALYISTEQAATVTVSINGTGWSQTLNIPANTVNASVIIPKSGPDDARILTDGLSNRGIHIVSNVPVAVYAHVYALMVSGATMLMPVETYGYTYYSINYYQTTSQSNPGDWYSWFYAIASEDNTRIEITPSDTTKNGWLPGQTYTVNLNKGEMFNVFGKAGPFNTNNYALCSKDMTGSKIVSVPGNDGNCHPVAVFSGSGGIRFCRGDGGEFVHQQVFPAQAWGTRYLTYHTMNNTTTDINETNRNFYRVCVQDPTAVVKRNGVVLTGLINNFFYEFMDSTGGDYITSDKPILVAQYTPNKNQCWNFPTSIPAPLSYGDPEMFYLSPIEQGQKSVLFYTSRKNSIDYVYTNIHVPTIAINSLRVDGNPVPVANTRIHPNNPAYTVAVARFIGPAAQHTITCDSTVTATVYGLGHYESYGYNVGTLINNLNNYSQIKNVYNTTGNIDTFTCPKSPTRLFAKLATPAVSIHWKLSQVPNITPNTDSIINNPVPLYTEQINGRTYYVYTLQQDFIFSDTGTYYIPITYTKTVLANCTETENITVKIIVKPGPVSNFNFSSPACLKDSVYFTGTAIPGVFILNNYLWTFDDATTQTTVNAVKKFATAGNHDVRYRVIATNGCVGDTTKTINVFDSPVANFGVTNPICQTDSVYLTDSTLISSGTIASWQWNFGDGNTITRTNNSPFYHHYTAPGPYTISLVVNSNNGCKSDTMRRSINVFVSPIAKFGYSGNICVTDSIRFTDTSSVASGTITSWQWNFGDGNTLIRNNNSAFWHPYTTTGNFVVSLVVFSNNGCKSDTFRRTVSVNNRPSATMTNSGLPCIDSLQRFVSSYTAGASPATWWWDFGDGQNFTSTSTNTASHSYTSGLSNIIIRHVVNLGAGCVSDTAALSIPLINPNPVASFTAIADTACVNKPVQFNSTSTGVAIWNWNFGNGTGTSAPPFIRTYSSANTYNISLIVANAAGCRSLPANNSITINPNPSINAGPDKFLNSGGSTTLDATITNPSNYNFTWTPSIFLSASNILNPTATPDITTDYSILAVDKLTDCTATDNVTVNIITGLYVPSGFTPNRDGKNDVWQIPGLALYPDALVQVFNRYGENVYQTKDYTSRPWDGKYKGTDQPNGVFVYLIQLNDAEKRILKGYVTIIR
jgi:gliding motility-associated-like protein